MTKLMSLIFTDSVRAGDGSSMDSPVRMVKELWTPEGELFMHHDPCALIVTPEKMKFAREWFFQKLGESPKTKELWNELMQEFSNK